MKFFASAAVAAALALAATPASALERPAPPTAGDNTGSNQQTAERPATGGDSRPTADSNPGTARALAAPGRYCKDASKKRVKGERAWHCVRGVREGSGASSSRQDRVAA